MFPVSDIKLIRTDTTLDLSQKAEKGMPSTTIAPLFILYCYPTHCSAVDVGALPPCAVAAAVACAAMLLIEIALADRLWEAVERE